MTILASIFGKVLYSLTLGFLLDSQNHFEITIYIPLRDSEWFRTWLSMQYCTQNAALYSLRLLERAAQSFLCSLFLDIWKNIFSPCLKFLDTFKEIFTLFYVSLSSEFFQK